MLIFSVSFQKHLLRQGRVKRRQQNTEMLRATCSADDHRCRPDSNNTKDTRVFEGSRRTAYRDQKNVCSRQKLPPTCNVRCTQARHEKQRSTKTKENTVNVKYSRVGTCVRYTTGDVLKFRVKSRLADKRRVYMSCTQGFMAELIGVKVSSC